MNIAHYLLNQVHLVIGTTRARIVEVEYYANPDPYIHGTVEQTRPYCWYFHKKGSSFRGGTYKGLDFTFGDNQVHHCGVLLRSIQIIATGQIIEGPCMVVNFILGHTSMPDIAHLVATYPSYPPAAADPASLLYIEGAELPPLSIAQGPRVGLSAKHPQYLMRPLRFTTVPHDLKKGRPLLLLHMHVTDPHPPPPSGNLNRWLPEAGFDGGVNSASALADFNTSLPILSVKTVSEQCQAYGYCYRSGWCV